MPQKIISQQHFGGERPLFASHNLRKLPQFRH